MHIFLINHYAGSNKHGMEYRPFYLAREWVKLGHRVTIIAASFSHLHTQPPQIIGDITEEYIDGINYIWLKTPVYQGNGVRRVLNMIAFSWQLQRYKKLLADKCKPDVVIASSPHPFIIYGARSISRYAGAKLVFEVRDLWPITLIELGSISPQHPFMMLMQYTENYAYRVSDLVVSLLPKAKQHMEEHGLKSEKFTFLPNGIDIEEWQNDKEPIPDQHRKVLSQLREKGQFIIGYAGGHGISNALKYLIEAAALLKEHPVAIVLVGQGPEKENLQKQAQSLGLNNTVFLPPVTKTAIPELLDSMDALFIGWNKEPLYRFGISPNKLMDYMMAAKPVIHSIEAGNDLVAGSGCGISVPPEDPSVIAEAVVQLMQMDAKEHKTMGLKGREYVMSYHDYKVLAKRFIDCIGENK